MRGHTTVDDCLMILPPLCNHCGRCCRHTGADVGAQLPSVGVHVHNRISTGAGINCDHNSVVCRHECDSPYLSNYPPSATNSCTVNCSSAINTTDVNVLCCNSSLTFYGTFFVTTKSMHETQVIQFSRNAMCSDFGFFVFKFLAVNFLCSNVDLLCILYILVQNIPGRSTAYCFFALLHYVQEKNSRLYYTCACRISNGRNSIVIRPRRGL